MSQEVATTERHDYLPPGLTQEEGEFLHNVEVLGMPARAAAKLAGMSFAKLAAPHIIQARELVREKIRGVVGIKREDVLHMLLEVRQRAQYLNEPMSEIAALDRIIKMEGYDAPKKVDINFNETSEAVRTHISRLSDAELIARLDAGNVIDVDFHEVRKEG